MATEPYNSAIDPFYQNGAKVPYGMTAITPNDTTDLPIYALLYATAAGTISFIPVYGDDSTPVTMTVPAGWQSPCLVRRVHATGTSATLYSLDKVR